MALFQSVALMIVNKCMTFHNICLNTLKVIAKGKVFTQRLRPRQPPTVWWQYLDFFIFEKTAELKSLLKKHIFL